MADLPAIPEAAEAAAYEALMESEVAARGDWPYHPDWSTATRDALLAATPHIRAATLDEVDDAIPRGGSTELALWLERHGLSVGAGPAAVLTAIRQDLRALAGAAEESP